MLRSLVGSEMCIRDRLVPYRRQLASPTLGPSLCQKMVADCVPCLQLNTHKAQLAHKELLHVLDEHPETICFIQEPYTVRSRLVTLPRDADCYPREVESPRTAVFVPKKLRSQGLPQFTDRDCSAVLIPGSAQPIIIASVYMDINMTVESPRLVGLLEYAASKSWGLLMAVDTNAHSILYGPCLLYTSPSPRDS